MKSNWAKVRDYVNSKEIGHIFTRPDLMLYAKLNGINLNTMDTERNHLLHGGFLKHIAIGRYELIKKIPDGMTTTELFLLQKGDNLQYLERVMARKAKASRKIS